MKESSKNEPIKTDGSNYPSVDDIYNKGEKVSDINPDDLSKIKPLQYAESPGKLNEKDFEEDMSGSDLDIPGTEINETDMMTGEEDEENDFYSLGGDNHTDLEEDQGN